MRPLAIALIALVGCPDAIPFTSSLRFDLELWDWNPDTTLFYDTLATFYVAPEARDRLAPPAPGDFRVP